MTAPTPPDGDAAASRRGNDRPPRGSRPAPKQQEPVAPLSDESPGLPGLHRWSTVYLLVFVAFILVVVGLAVFSSVYA